MDPDKLPLVQPWGEIVAAAQNDPELRPNVEQILAGFRGLVAALEARSG